MSEEDYICTVFPGTQFSPKGDDVYLPDQHSFRITREHGTVYLKGHFTLFELELITTIAQRVIGDEDKP